MHFSLTLPHELSNPGKSGSCASDVSTSSNNFWKLKFQKYFLVLDGIHHHHHHHHPNNNYTENKTNHRSSSGTNSTFKPINGFITNLWFHFPSLPYLCMYSWYCKRVKIYETSISHTGLSPAHF